MKPRINVHAFRQTTCENANLCVLDTIAHPMSEEGNYVGSISRNGKQITTFHLNVDSEFKHAQTDIDLATIAEKPELIFEVKLKGYVVFYVSQGKGGFQVLLNKLPSDGKSRKKPRKSPVFDSRILQQNDMFIVSLIRPGRYEIWEKYGKSKGQIRVAYPKPGKRPFVAPKPKTVNITEKGFDISELDVKASQGIVFTVEAPKSLLKINLVKPDDGPYEKGEPNNKVRWNNPLPPHTKKG